MVELMHGINPDILKWARERSGFTQEEAYRGITSNVDTLHKWEMGQAAPTYRQLVKLADKYGRPIAIFYFPEPPDELEPGREFRTLPSSEVAKLSPSVLILIREAHARQLHLYELTRVGYQAGKKIFIDIQVTTSTPPQQAARLIRDYLGINMQVQTEWRSSDEALKAWRSAIQDAGIFVFKEPFYSESTDGFCIFDIEFPLIYLNNTRPKNRQIFTLLHELAHVMIKSNGITQDNQDYVEALRGINREIELFANDLAAECLMPYDDFVIAISKFERESILLTAEQLSDRYKVSREAILVRMMKLNYISIDAFEEARSKLYKSSKENRPGGTFYNNITTYLGEKYLGLAFGQYYANNCTINQLAEYLGIKASQIPSLEDRVFLSV